VPALTDKSNLVEVGPQSPEADVVFLSSIFGRVKVAEPMGVSILTAALRAKGIRVVVKEPSVEGWSIEQAADIVIATGAPIVALSMLRDKNVDDVLKFCETLRRRGSGQFVIIGGHGPSLTMSGLPNGIDVREFMKTGPQPAEVEQCGPGTAPPLLTLGPVKNNLISEPEVSGRGQGPGDITVARPGHSTYYDVSREYLAILTHINAFMLGESDVTFPELVVKVLKGEDHTGTPGLVYADASGRLRKNPMPPKIANLDVLPLMSRDVYEQYQGRYQDLPASILASRGCFYRCTFCSVVKYEKLQDGLSHRFRSNENLVEEMVQLHDRYGCDKFNFEDDNFIVKNKAGKQRLHELCDMLKALPFRPQFTFFCRADVVEHELFAHLKEAGLTGIYFGLESVYEGDLEFFHKGLRVEQMYAALDTLGELGFGPAVDSDLRIMLGYITWHPMTSYESLAATVAFLRQYDAPPKLLRRKLRLYAGTEVLTDVTRLGLLAPEHRDGWLFANEHLQGLDDRVNDLFTLVNRRRDMLRTVEKAKKDYLYDVPQAQRATELRRKLDAWLYDSFEAITATSRRSEAGGESSEVRTLVDDLKSEHLSFAQAEDMDDLIRESYDACGFDLTAVDLFRK
jgi:hypothetical protein